MGRGAKCTVARQWGDTHGTGHRHHANQLMASPIAESRFHRVAHASRHTAHDPALPHSPMIYEWHALFIWNECGRGKGSSMSNYECAHQCFSKQINKQSFFFFFFFRGFERVPFFFVFYATEETGNRRHCVWRATAVQLYRLNSNEVHENLWSSPITTNPWPHSLIVFLVHFLVAANKRTISYMCGNAGLLKL